MKKADLSINLRQSGPGGRSRKCFRRDVQPKTGRRAARARPAAGMIAGGLSLLLLAGCGRAPDRAEADSGPALQVTVEEVRATTEANLEAVPGQVRPVRSAVLSGRIQGAVEELFAAPGQSVERGEVLAVLGSEELGARARRASAELEAASLELERVRSLIESNAATPRELEAAEARHRSAEALLDEAQTFLDYATVRAPFDGQISRKHVEAGDLVSPGQPIFDMLSPESFRLEAWAPESLARAIEAGDSIAFEIEGAFASGSGVVSEVGPALDAASRTVLVKVDLPRNSGLRSGQYGRLLLAGDEARRLTVPETGIRKLGQLTYVFVVAGEPAAARLRLVQTGLRQGGRVEILAGLNEGEWIVAEIPSGLRDGQAVEIVR